MSTRSYPVHPNFNSRITRELRENEIRRHRCAHALRIISLPENAPVSVAHNGNGIVSGASGFLPCFRNEHRIVTFTLDGAPVVRRSARKAWRASVVMRERAVVASML